MASRDLKFLVGGVLLCTLGGSTLLAADDERSGFGILPSCNELAPNVEDVQDEAVLSRQDIREEMLKIRMDHEEWEEQRDALKLQCLNAKGQERSQCLQNGQALKEQQQAMQTRLKSLHEKLAVMRREQNHNSQASGITPPVAEPVSAQR